MNSEEERKLTAQELGWFFLKNEVLLLFFIFFKGQRSPNPFSEGAEANFLFFQWFIRVILRSIA
jgi:hypothetical protein